MHRDDKCTFETILSQSSWRYYSWIKRWFLFRVVFPTYKWFVVSCFFLKDWLKLPTSDTPMFGFWHRSIERPPLLSGLIVIPRGWPLNGGLTVMLIMPTLFASNLDSRRIHKDRFVQLFYSLLSNANGSEVERTYRSY